MNKLSAGWHGEVSRSPRRTTSTIGRGLTASGVAAAMIVAGFAAFSAHSAGAATTATLTANVDAGGSGAVLADGTVWTKDAGFTGGGTYTSPDSVTCTNSTNVVKSTRYGMSAYTLAVPNGTYAVTFVMLENYWKASGKRVFSATAEGVTAFANLDLYATVGHDKELDKTVTVTVADGKLNLGFKATKDKPILSGLRVVQLSTPVVTTTAPAPVTTTPAPAPTTSSPAPAPTTSSPAPAPTTVAPAPIQTTTAPAPTTASAAALRFSPPVLVNPITVAYPSSGTFTGSSSLDLTRDYIVTLPTSGALVNPKGLQITGGRNVVIIGGTIDVKDGDATSGARRGMYLSKATPNGTTYIEGVRLMSSTQGSLTEGIDLASPNATVVLQNVKIEGALSGSYATNHADMIQAWAGPAVLNIDGFSATTGYQGFFLLPNQWDSSPVRDWSLNRMSLTGVDSAYMLWRDGGTYAINTSDVYVAGSHIANGGLWPNAAAWPGVTVGAAPVDYAATAGFGYVSPGYR